MRIIYKKLILIVALQFFILSIHAQSESFPKEDSLNLDSSIRYGKLTNGLTYFIKNVNDAQSKIHMRLISKAGRNLEEDGQLNIAHSLEHLAFKATKNFPLGIFNSYYLDQMGISLSDLMGFTGYEGTLYGIKFSEDRMDVLDKGLLWFKDIASGLMFTDQDIDQVRGEVIQELIIREGGNLNGSFAKTKLEAEFFPCKLDNSDFFEQHRYSRADEIKKFHSDWYHPNLMAITVVGDIKNLDQVERKIKASFSDLVFSSVQKEIKNCHQLYFNRPPQFTTIERQTDTSGSVIDKAVNFHLYYRAPEIGNKLPPIKSVDRGIILQILIAVANERFKEVTDQYNSFDLISVSGPQIIKEPSMEIVLTVENQNEKQALEKSLDIIHQLQKYGISSEELEKQKEINLQNLDIGNLSNAPYWNSEFFNFYIYGEKFPTEKQNYIKENFVNLNVQEFNNYVKDWLSKIPDDIGIIAPVGHKLLNITQEEIRSWIKDWQKKPLEPYSQPGVPDFLMNSEELSNLKVQKYKIIEEGQSGSKEIVLDNGVKIILKSFKTVPASENKRVKLQGFSLKGADDFPQEDFFSTFYAPAIVQHSGVNGLDKFQLRKFLSNNNKSSISVSPYVDHRETGIYGDSDLKDLEIMLQVIYFYFTSPNKNQLAFEDWKMVQHKAYNNPSSKDFDDKIGEVLGEVSGPIILGKKQLMGGTKNYKGLDETNLERSYQIYNELFGNAKDFTFIISGELEYQKVLPLIQKFLGNLPNKDIKSKYGIKKKRFKIPKGPYFHEILPPGDYELKNINYGIRFIGKTDNCRNWKEQIKIQALGYVLNKRFWDLRVEKGYGLYDLNVFGQFNKDKCQYEVVSKLVCAPEELNPIRNEAKKFFEEIRSGFIKKEIFDQGLSSMYNLYEPINENNPRVMHQKLYDHYRYNQPWTDAREVQKFVKNTSINDLVETANKYVLEDNMYEFVMRDKKLK